MTAYEPLTFNITGDVDHELIRRMANIRDMLQQIRDANRNLNNLRNGAHRATNAFERLFASIRRIAFYRAIRAVLREISEGFSEGRDNAYQYSKVIGGEFAASMDRLATSTFYLKNSIGAMVMPIYNALVPAIEWLIDRFVVLINIVNQFFSLLNGAATWTRALKYPREYADATKSATGAVKELQKTILGFDEINKLNKQPTSGGGGLADALDYSKMFEQADYSAFLKKHLQEIEAMLAGFEFVLGTILTLTGHPFLGIPLMVHGIHKMFQVHGSIDWDSASTQVANTLALIESTVGTFALALGVLLLGVPGHLGMALALIFAGATMLWSGISVNWEAANADISTALMTIVGIVSGIPLAVGAILLLTGANVPIGLALVAIGVANLATAMRINWDDMPDNVKATLDKITPIIGGAMLAIGAIMLFAVPSLMPLAIGLMVSGGLLALAPAIAVNWDAIVTTLTTVGAIVIRLIPTLLIVIGLVFMASGNFLLGLGLLVAGGIGTYVTMTPDLNWDVAVQRVQKVADDIKNVWIGLKTWLQNFRLPQLNLNASKTLNLFGQTISVPTMAFYASGGFPDQGSLFVAGEAGAEMVGNLGGRTAVANSNQIVDGIAQGLKYANADEIRLMREQNDLLRQILAKEGTATITLSSVTNALERKNQRDGSTYVPVG